MKTRTWIILLVLILTVSALAAAAVLRPEEAAFVEVYSDGQLLYALPLSIDREVTVPAPGGGENTVTVRDGAVAVTSATCPDHYCMQRGFCTGGTAIVCLPNLLVLEFTQDQGIDGAVG